MKCVTLPQIVYSSVPIQMGPYIRLSDDYLALASSYGIVALLFSCVVLKFATLTELDDLRVRLGAKLLDLACVQIKGTLTMIS